MFWRCSTQEPAEIAGTIEVSKPIRALGYVTDIHGVKWDIYAIQRDYVNACRVNELNEYYTDTSGMPSSSTFVSQTWLPYKVKVVK